MFVLVLNDMRFAQVEQTIGVVRAESSEEILKFLERERVESYREERWWKSFRKGGPLEWFNPPYDHELPRMILNVGTLEDWMHKAADRYRDEVLGLPEVPK